METEELREYCLNKKGVTESFPFDGETLVFKIGNKMFLLLPLENIRLLSPQKPIRNGVMSYVKNTTRFPERII